MSDFFWQNSQLPVYQMKGLASPWDGQRPADGFLWVDQKQAEDTHHSPDTRREDSGGTCSGQSAPHLPWGQNGPHVVWGLGGLPAGTGMGGCAGTPGGSPAEATPAARSPVHSRGGCNPRPLSCASARRLGLPARRMGQPQRPHRRRHRGVGVCAPQGRSGSPVLCSRLSLSSDVHRLLTDPLSLHHSDSLT